MKTGCRGDLIGDLRIVGHQLNLGQAEAGQGGYC